MIDADYDLPPDIDVALQYFKPDEFLYLLEKKENRMRHPFKYIAYLDQLLSDISEGSL